MKKAFFIAAALALGLSVPLTANTRSFVSSDQDYPTGPAPVSDGVSYACQDDGFANCHITSSFALTSTDMPPDPDIGLAYSEKNPMMTATRTTASDPVPDPVYCKATSFGINDQGATTEMSVYNYTGTSTAYGNFFSEVARE